MTETSLALIDSSAPGVPALIARAGDRAARRFLEFFTVHIRNPNTRAAYGRAAGAFLGWCQDHGIAELRQVQPVHVAAYVEQLSRERSAPTVKQHLACIRMLFDWLVTGQVMASNPAHAVRGPRHSVSKGATAVISSIEARELLDSMDVSTVVGLRDRALVAVMAFTFARVSAVVNLKVEDYYPQKKRWWLRLREKNGKVNEMPRHHTLEAYLDEYLKAAGIGEERKEPLFRAALGRTGQLSPRALSRIDVWYMHRNTLRNWLRAKMVESDPLNVRSRSTLGNHGPAPRCRLRIRNRDWLPHLSRHRHYRLSDQRRQARNCATHGRTLERQNHRPLRPP